MTWNGLSDFPHKETKEPGLYILTYIGHWVWDALGKVGELGQSDSLPVKAISLEEFT